jgi:hypothetical protein
MPHMDPLEMLAAGVPLTLLMDLARPDGPLSHRLLVDERADLDWVPGVQRSRQH